MNGHELQRQYNADANNEGSVDTDIQNFKGPAIAILLSNSINSAETVESLTNSPTAPEEIHDALLYNSNAAQHDERAASLSPQPLICSLFTSSASFSAEIRNRYRIFIF